MRPGEARVLQKGAPGEGYGPLTCTFARRPGYAAPMTRAAVSRAHAVAALLLIGAGAFLGAVLVLLCAPLLLVVSPVLLASRRPAQRRLSRVYARRRKATQYRQLQRQVRRAR